MVRISNLLVISLTSSTFPNIRVNVSFSRRPYPNRTITGTSERQRTLAPSLTLARRHPPGLGKTPSQHNFLHPTALPRPRLLKAQRNHPLRRFRRRGSYIGSVPVRQLSWPQSTAVSPHRPHLPERLQLLERTTR